MDIYPTLDGHLGNVRNWIYMFMTITKREDCTSAIEKSKASDGQLQRRTPKHIVKKLSALKMKKRRDQKVDCDIEHFALLYIWTGNRIYKRFLVSQNVWITVDSLITFFLCIVQNNSLLDKYNFILNLSISILRCWFINSAFHFSPPRPPPPPPN